MPAAWTGDQHLLVRRMKIDEEVLVRCVCKDTRGRFTHASSRKFRKDGCQRSSQCVDLIVVYRSPDVIGIIGSLATVHHRRFYTARQSRKSVADVTRFV